MIADQNRSKRDPQDPQKLSWPGGRLKSPRFVLFPAQLVTDVLGASGHAMSQAIAAGEDDYFGLGARLVLRATGNRLRQDLLLKIRLRNFSIILSILAR